jgi:hypothetical protein
MGGHILQNNATSADLGLRTDLNVAEDAGACPDHRPIANFRMPIASFFPGPT